MTTLLEQAQSAAEQAAQLLMCGNDMSSRSRAAEALLALVAPLAKRLDEMATLPATQPKPHPFSPKCGSECFTGSACIAQPKRFTAPEPLPVGCVVRIVEFAEDADHNELSVGSVVPIIRGSGDAYLVGGVEAMSRAWVRTVELVEDAEQLSQLRSELETAKRELAAADAALEVTRNGPLSTRRLLQDFASRGKEYDRVLDAAQALQAELEAAQLQRNAAQDECADLRRERDDLLKLK